VWLSTLVPEANGSRRLEIVWCQRVSLTWYEQGLLFTCMFTAAFLVCHGTAVAVTAVVPLAAAAICNVKARPRCCAYHA
jgi:hypothetical protein